MVKKKKMGKILSEKWYESMEDVRKRLRLPPCDENFLFITVFGIACCSLSKKIPFFFFELVFVGFFFLIKILFL